jgi:CubicO group peptidase (beta-lactamase class C family)
MGRLGLLVVARGQWRGVEVIPRSFVEELESKQTRGMRVNYDGPDDGRVGLDPKAFPEAPYGYMTWVNTSGDYYPGADTAWAWGAGAGGTTILWNHKTGIVFAGVCVDTGPKAKGIPRVIEAAITGANPLVTPQTTEAR